MCAALPLSAGDATRLGTNREGSSTVLVPYEELTFEDYSKYAPKGTVTSHLHQGNV